MINVNVFSNEKAWSKRLKKKDLFFNKIQILCETEKTRPDLLEWAQDWFKKIGMNLREMDPVAHDQHIAYVSHLSHISSYMLGKTVMEKEKDQATIFDMAGSGFASTVFDCCATTTTSSIMYDIVRKFSSGKHSLYSHYANFGIQNGFGI